MKFNVDDSSHGKPGPTGCGDILRDVPGSGKDLFSSPLGYMCSNEVELIDIKATLHLYASSQWVHPVPIVLEFDFVVVVSWVCNKDSRP